MLTPIIISAPFGNWCNYPGATSTLGTFTLKYRGGIAKRLWRCALTLRPYPRAGAWINRLGLPNPGIDSLGHGNYSDKIISIHGFDADEWRLLAYGTTGTGRNAGMVELNLSCPNVGHTHYVTDVRGAVRWLQEHTVGIIAKLPPVRWMNYVDPLYDMGVRHFHCFNTIPTPGGGISGKPLRHYVLWATEEITHKYSDAVVIAGGGVTCLQDVKDYITAGADHVAIGSALLNPFRWKTIRRLTRCKFDLEKRNVYFDE